MSAPKKKATKKKSGWQRTKEARERTDRELAELRRRAKGGGARKPAPADDDDDDDDDDQDDAGDDAAPAPASSSSLPIHQTDPKVDAGANPMMWAAVPLVPPATPDDDEEKPDDAAAAAAAAGEEQPPADGKAEPVTAGIPKAKAPPPPEEANGAKTMGGMLVGLWAFGGVVTATCVAELAPELEDAPEPLIQAINFALSNWMNPTVTSVIGNAGEQVALKYGLARIVKTPDEVIVLGAVAVPLIAMVALKKLQKRHEGAGATSSESSSSSAPARPPAAPRVVINAHAVEVRRDEPRKPNGTPPPAPAGGDAPTQHDWGFMGKIPQRGRAS